MTWWLWTAITWAADGEPVGDGFALSVGTGPRPISTATLGLTGLGARAMFPVGRAVPWVGLQVSSVGVASFDDGERSDRFVTRASSVHGSGGLRFDLADRTARSVSSYALVGVMAGRATGASVDVADDYVYKSYTTTVLGLAGLGVDGFVSKHLSIGGELGVLGGKSYGNSLEVENGNPGESDGKAETTVFSSFTGLMLTVWR
jgi:hypothetical protein